MKRLIGLILATLHILSVNGSTYADSISAEGCWISTHIIPSKAEPTIQFCIARDSVDIPRAYIAPGSPLGPYTPDGNPAMILDMHSPDSVYILWHSESIPAFQDMTGISRILSTLSYGEKETYTIEAKFRRYNERLLSGSVRLSQSIVNENGKTVKTYVDTILSDIVMMQCVPGTYFCNYDNTELNYLYSPIPEMDYDISSGFADSFIPPNRSYYTHNLHILRKNIYLNHIYQSSNHGIRLMRTGDSTHIPPYSGIETTLLSDKDRRKFGIPEGGLLISGMAPDSPAWLSGIKKGWVIISVNGRPVSKALDLSDFKPFEVVQLEILKKKGKRQIIEVELSFLPPGAPSR